MKDKKIERRKKKHYLYETYQRIKPSTFRTKSTNTLPTPLSSGLCLRASKLAASGSHFQNILQLSEHTPQKAKHSYWPQAPVWSEA
jgi:hypothetical protein